MSADVVSTDLVWEITRNQSSLLCKRKQAGGVQFSRDPMNLVNEHSRKYEGFVSPQAIGIQPGPNGGIVLTTKKANKQQKPSQMYQRVTIPKSTSTRRAFRTVVNSTTKRGYRSDLRAEAVARASRIRESQRPVKADKQRKLRGSKARKAREVKA